MPRNQLPAWLLFGFLGWLACGATAAETVHLVVDGKLAASAEKALTDLEQALKSKQFDPVRRQSLADTGPRAIVVGVAGDSATVDRLLTRERIDLPRQAESLCIQRLRSQQPVLLIAGRDARGLGYALLEAARAIELAPVERDALAAVSETVEAPFLRVRSLTVHPFNEDLDAQWYFDERFWRDYFAMLARDRYNNVTLTFSDQTNYLNPIYAYLVEVRQFPQVRIKGLTAALRQRNLAMLRRIAELASERGLDFTLGVWMQAPVPDYPGTVLVENLPAGLAAADYCSQGLKQVLEACPAITGVQFRMNSEAGVPEEKQTEFYRPLFRAIGECGRPIRLDVRYKGLQPTTTKAALDAGLDVTVSTKFWCEHMGLPYHPTVADRHYRESRYSFGSLLDYPRTVRVTYQLWTVGSQRLLLWGDPEYAARFAESCRLGEGDGFEVFAPLTNKGYGNEPGTWRIFADRSFDAGDWEYQRYWFFYLAFGRLGYNPTASPEVWRRELRHRFGEAATDIEAAYKSASQIIPLITATRSPSAGEWRWWPEMETGGRLTEYMHTQPSDTAQFYAIRSWKRTPGWSWEEWDDTIPGYAEDAARGQVSGKTTPLEVARILSRLAEQTEQSLQQPTAKISDARAAEFRGTELDLGVLAQLARYHAEKTQAATHLAFFELTQETSRLPEALKHMRAAADAWRQIVARTGHVYYDNLVFGIARGSPRSRGGQHHSGHWKDRLAEIQEDLDYLERLIGQHGGQARPVRTFPGETPLAAELDVRHEPITTARANVDLTISLRARSQASIERLLLHYRPLDQTVDWKQMPMKPDADRWQAVVPGKDISARYDFQYYFEVQLEGGGGRIWPSWQEGPPYVVTKVSR